jgi:hypothetical protein
MNMGKIVSVDVKHQLGAEEARRRVHEGVDALKEKYAEKLSIVTIVWSDMHADIKITAMGHALTGAMDFLPDCVRVSLELPLMLALLAEKAKGMIAQHTGDLLKLPPPKQG